MNPKPIEVSLVLEVVKQGLLEIQARAFPNSGANSGGGSAGALMIRIGFFCWGGGVIIV